MAKRKTNIDYLRELCADNDEMIEFIDAIENEITELRDAARIDQEKINEEEKRADDAEEELESFEGWIDPSELTTIDCGIGTIQWTADNLQLQSRVEELLAPLALTPQTAMLLK